MAIIAPSTLDEILALPESRPYLEFANGEVLPKPMPDYQHSPLVAEIVSLLRNFVRQDGGGYVDTELRHLHRPEARLYLPDVSITRWEKVPDRSQNPMEVMPDLAVEVLSPDDRPGRVADKVEFYLRNGVSLVWLVDPEREAITIHRPDAEPETVAGDAVVDAEPVLAGFEVRVADIFAVLHEGPGQR